MSESFYPTKQQIMILKLIYEYDRTFAELADELLISVSEVRELCEGQIGEYLEVTLPMSPSLGYGPSVVSIKMKGQAFIEQIFDREKDHRMEVRHYWLGILLGGLLGWLLTSFGTPKDLFSFLSGLFR